MNSFLALGASGGPEGWLLVWLGLMALAAGFVDAVVGGGGLIQVPALFSALPQASPGALFGTNKIAAITGTFMAALRYAVRIKLSWPVLIPALVGAGLFSWLGAAVVSQMPRSLVEPLVLLLLVLVGWATLKRKDMGLVHDPGPVTLRRQLFGFAAGAGIGFYDGFFGPGTGIFLIFVFVRGFGYDFLHASASAKLINVMTNFAALLFFVPAGAFFIQAAVLMALCNVFGALIGAQIAVKKGSRFVRQFFLLLLSLLIARMAFSVLEPFL